MRIKRIVIGISLAACLFPTFASAQSFWVHKPVYANNGNGSIFRLADLDSEDCVFLPDGFYPAITRDYGQTWIFIFLDSTRSLRNFSVTGLVHPARNLIILGCNDHNVGLIVRSTDGGKTWKDTVIGSYDKTKAQNSIVAISALNSGHILVLTKGGFFLHSSDEGLTWKPLSCPIFSYYSGSSRIVNNVASYPSPNTILIASIPPSSYANFTTNSTIYRTTDLGLTWDSSSQMNSNITKFAFINQRVGFASGTLWNLSTRTETATVDKTTDSGRTWSNIFSQQIVPSSGFFKNTAGLFSIAFADSLRGFACGDQGLILQTIDGGVTWNEMTSDFTYDIQGADVLGDVSYPDTNHAIISSSSGDALIYYPNGILNLPNITYPLFSPPSAPHTFDVTWDTVPGATRYSITITTSGYPDSNTALVLKDTNVTTDYYHLSNLVDTSPPPGQGGRQYDISLQAFNATNESNIAHRTFIVSQSSNGVVNSANNLSAPAELYPNPATNWLTTQGFSGLLTIYDALGRTRYCPWQDGKLNIANLPAGIYYVSDGSRHAKFVKQ